MTLSQAWPDPLTQSVMAADGVDGEALRIMSDKVAIKLKSHRPGVPVGIGALG